MAIPIYRCRKSGCWDQATGQGCCCSRLNGAKIFGVAKGDLQRTQAITSLRFLSFDSSSVGPTGCHGAGLASKNAWKKAVEKARAVYCWVPGTP